MDIEFNENMLQLHRELTQLVRHLSREKTKLESRRDNTSKEVQAVIESLEERQKLLHNHIVRLERYMQGQFYPCQLERMKQYEQEIATTEIKQQNCNNEELKGLYQKKIDVLVLLKASVLLELVEPTTLLLALRELDNQISSYLSKTSST